MKDINWHTVNEAPPVDDIMYLVYYENHAFPDGDITFAHYEEGVWLVPELDSNFHDWTSDIVYWSFINKPT